MAKAIHKSGSRKRAVARATLKSGTGKVRINNQMLDVYGTKLIRLRLKEPLILAGDTAAGVDINVNVNGGGISSQADAARLAIARALAKHSKKLEKVFLDYDRHLLVADIRRKESSKPNRHGQARAKRQKSYR
ncbi:30S ribosomal protein S9 [Candidatus Woesearchaeota archaeon]|nr:30S ribosomal protein S9 [Candidatus Woesearchaeota archaeon]